MLCCVRVGCQKGCGFGVMWAVQSERPREEDVRPASRQGVGGGTEAQVWRLSSLGREPLECQAAPAARIKEIVAY
jgi:hypothetical protein